MTDIKCYMVLFAEFERMNNGVMESRLFSFQSKTGEIDSTTEIEGWFEENIKEPILAEMDEFPENGSGKLWFYYYRLNIHP